MAEKEQEQKPANSEQIEILKKNFPSCFDKDGKFVISKMEEIVRQNNVDVSRESYKLDWLGKSYARVLANEKILTLIKEDKVHNAKPDNKNSANILIKGDNLEVLKHLKNSYYEKIKMIYIDPPYNTGNDGFVYNDDRNFSTEQLVKLARISQNEAERILKFVNSKSNSHSAWLTFMYPRLYIAKELLKNDGVIFISIDDNEVAQLRLLCDDIFGEENFVANIIWEKKYSPSNDSKTISATHDYILIYAKSISSWKLKLLPRTEDMNDRYKNIDNDPRGEWKSGGLSAKTYNEKYDYPIQTPSGQIVLPPSGSCWQVSKEKFNELVKDNRIYFGKDGSSKPQLKQFLSEVQDGKVPTTILKYDEVGHNQISRQELTSLFNGVFVFDNPKPTTLIKHFLKLVYLSENDIVLDFFAGSGTTAHAVMQLNSEDGGNRKFISVQIAEKIDEKKSKTAFDFVKNELNAEPTIFEITKERIIRASQKIKNELSQSLLANLSDYDFGFKIYENVPAFAGMNDEHQFLTQDTIMFDGSILNDEELETVLTTYKLQDGIKLDVNLQEIVIGSYKYYKSENIIYMMNKGFTTNDLKLLLEKFDNDRNFKFSKIVIYNHNFLSKHMREIYEAFQHYTNKKSIQVTVTARF